MGNLLTNPGLWRDASADLPGDSPPSIWNGTQYRRVWDGIYANFSIALNGTYVRSQGDRVSGAFRLGEFDQSNTLDVMALTPDKAVIEIFHEQIEPGQTINFDVLIPPEADGAQLLAVALGAAAYRGNITLDPTTLEAVADAAATTAGVPVIIDVLANDRLDGAPVTLDQLVGPPVVVAVRPANAGTAFANSNGTITFAPAAGFSGDAEFDYRIETPAPAPCTEVTLASLEPGTAFDISSPPPWWDQVPNGGYLAIEPSVSPQWAVSAIKNGDAYAVIDSTFGFVPYPYEPIEVAINYTALELAHCCHYRFVGT